MADMKTRTAIAADDLRVVAPIFTTGEAALLTGLTRSKTYAWAKRDLVTTVERKRRGWPTVPLLGLAEYATFGAWRQAKLPMAEVTAAANYIREEISEFGFLDHNVVHDGTLAYLQRNQEIERIVGGQMALFSVVERWLKPFVFDEDGLIRQFRIQKIPGVVVDPRFNGGRMMFEDSGVPLFAVAGMLTAGEIAAVVADEFAISEEQVERVEANLSWVSAAA